MEAVAVAKILSEGSVTGVNLDFSTIPTVRGASVTEMEQPMKFATKRTNDASVKRT